MQREINNVAKVCQLPGFRYIAFTPAALPDAAASLPFSAVEDVGDVDRSGADWARSEADGGDDVAPETLDAAAPDGLALGAPPDKVLTLAAAMHTPPLAVVAPVLPIAARAIAQASVTPGVLPPLGPPSYRARPVAVPAPSATASRPPEFALLAELAQAVGPLTQVTPQAISPAFSAAPAGSEPQPFALLDEVEVVLASPTRSIRRRASRAS